MNGFARQIAALAGALGLSLAVPVVASASQSFVVTSPTGFPANGDPSYTTTQNLDSGTMGEPGNVTITLAPGVLASLAANASCVKTLQYTSACQIGGGSATTSSGAGLGLTAYLVPPPNPSTDAAGIDLLTGPPANQTTHVAVDLVQNASGNVASVLKLNLSSLGPLLGGLLTKMSLTVNGTLGGKPFTRMPSNCNITTHSSLTVQYAKGTETSQASPDFAPTGCSSLPFTPQVSATAVKDPHNDGVEITTTQTQPLGQAAGLTTVLQLPWPAIGTNTSAVALQNTSTPVGTAVATSPLQPAPLKGYAYLTGSGPFTPSLTLRFPPPVALTLVGAVNLNNHTVTFSNQPDVPQTALVVTLFGGTQSLELATCSPPGGILHASNTGQNGVFATAAVPIQISGCPPAPKQQGKPKLSGVSLDGPRRRQARSQLQRGARQECAEPQAAVGGAARRAEVGVEEGDLGRRLAHAADCRRQADHHAQATRREGRGEDRIYRAARERAASAPGAQRQGAPQAEGPRDGHRRGRHSDDAQPLRPASSAPAAL